MNRKALSFIISLQEAYTAIVPFFLLTSVVTLLYFLLSYLNINPWFLPKKTISTIMKVLQSFTSLAAVSAIAYSFAARFKVSQIISITLAIAVFITTIFAEQHSSPIVLPYGFTPTTLFVPIASAYLLKLLYPYLSLNIRRSDGNFHIYRLFNYLLVFFFAYLLLVLAYLIIDAAMDAIIKHAISSAHFDLPDILIFTIREALVNILWFLGIHGAHTVNAIFGTGILFKEMLPNLTFGEFHRMFVSIGGAGVGVGLLIALITGCKEKPLKAITRISIPLVAFNIDTLLIYAVIVLNRLFVIPFVVMPLVNMAVAYWVLKVSHIGFGNYYVVWNTPPLIDVYLKTGGNPVAFALQLALIIADTLVYMHYVKRFSSWVKSTAHANVLKENLEITEEIRSEEGIQAFKAHKELIEAQAKLHEVVQTITKENLSIHYQPKVDMRNGSCDRFEALIRYRHNGRITGPTFLSIVERAGLAPIIDIWVSREVKNDFSRWKEHGINPEIGVNLHPDTLKSNSAITRIIELLQGERVIFEIIERSFLSGSVSENNLKRLKENGFGISIDDFGTGYSSFQTITRYEIDEIKIDKTLIDALDTKKGYLVCKHTSSLCHEIGCTVVAEGVERRWQVEILKQLDVDLVQGFYFAAPMTLDSAVEFSKKTDLSKNL